MEAWRLNRTGSSGPNNCTFFSVNARYLWTRGICRSWLLLFDKLVRNNNEGSGFGLGGKLGDVCPDQVDRDTKEGRGRPSRELELNRQRHLFAHVDGSNCCLSIILVGSDAEGPAAYRDGGVVDSTRSQGRCERRCCRAGCRLYPPCSAVLVSLTG